MASKTTDELIDSTDWKRHARWQPGGFFLLETADTRDVPVRLFLTASLLAEVEDSLYPQIINATRFPGVKLVVLTPDTHHGYGVPVGCVLVTDADQGAVAMGPVGYDIGCGMMSASSEVLAEEATPEKRLAFNRAVMRRVDMGAGGKGKKLGSIDRQEFEQLVRGGADEYVARHGASFDRSRAERHRIPVSDTWDIPWGGKGQPERGVKQLGSLGGGNHFIELQREEPGGHLYVQVHTGSRGFGHGLATNYFALAQLERPGEVRDIDLGYFTPDSRHYRGYLDAVAAGGNFAIVNRLILFEQVSEAFAEVFGRELSLVYEISHNLVQREQHPDLGDVLVHRKGATRAFPAGHPALVGTPWATTGHPVLIPGSNKDYSFILRPLPGASQSAYSVNHGAGRRLSRGKAMKTLSQRAIDDEYRAAGIVVNTDGRVPLDEAAPCYKPAEEVIQAVLDAGLAQVEHRLFPLSSLKGADGGARRPARHKKGKDTKAKGSSDHY